MGGPRRANRPGAATAAAFGIMAVAIGVATAGSGAHEPHWGYGKADGPGHWAELSPDWRVCAAGRNQAPIDLDPAQAGPGRAETAVLELKSESHRVDLLDNGHTLQAGDAGATVLTLGESRYELTQFHFHAPSEHTLAGRTYAMELHLVHQRADGALAVVGVLFEEGAANAVLARLWSALPREAGAHRELDAALDLSAVLPADHAAFRYQGSLTTPPCSEGVEWTVLSHPVTASREQIRAFTTRFGDDHRPTQPGNGRPVAVVDLTVR